MATGINGTSGNDVLTISTGDYIVYGLGGEDTLKFAYGAATANVWIGGSPTSYGYVGTDWATSTWRVDYEDIEHLDIVSGSGDDFLRGSYNAWDKIDGGAGVDVWWDNLGNMTSVAIDMASISLSGGQTLADGSVIRNVERVDNLVLTAGDDSFRDFGNYDDIVNGGSGKDNLGTSGGNDVFNGGDGDDTITIDWSSATANVGVSGGLYGSGHVGTFVLATSVSFFSIEHIDVKSGSGNDELLGSYLAWDKIDGGAGIDGWTDMLGNMTSVAVDMASISSSTGQTFADGSVIKNVEVASSLVLTDGNDSFRDNGNHNDAVYGGIGDDDLGTSGGIDYFEGGEGDDTGTIDWSSATENVWIGGDNNTGGYVGTDRISSTRQVTFDGIEHIDIKSGSGDDFLRGSWFWDKIDGGAGDDIWQDTFATLNSAVAIDMSVIAGATGQTLSDGSVIRNVEQAQDLHLSQGGDSFRDHGSYNDVVYGEGGDDDLGTSGGSDVFYGGLGDDTITIDWSSATENVWLDGNNANKNAYVGSQGTSTRKVNFESIEHINIKSGSGDDTLAGGSYAWDKIDGGAGVDTWHDMFINLTSGVSIDMSAISSAAGQAFSDGSLIKNVERAGYLVLTEENDSFRDNGNYDDTVLGYGGDDDLGTSGGKDTFSGGSGDDTITIDWSSATDNVWIGGNNVTRAYVGSDWASSTRSVDYDTIEHLVITSGSGNDYLQGFANGSDAIYAGAGNDTLDGGSVDASDIDVLYGQEGNDTYIVNSTSTALDIVFEGGAFAGGAGDVDTIISEGAFFWDYHDVGEVLTISASASVNSTMISGKGDSTINGNDATNFLLTYGGSNEVNGGKGVDYIGLGIYDLAASFNGVNSVKMRPGDDVDFIYDFESGTDKVDVSAYGRFTDSANLFANVAEANWGSYVWLGVQEGQDEFVCIVGLSKAELDAGDFIA